MIRLLISDLSSILHFAFPHVRLPSVFSDGLVKLKVSKPSAQERSTTDGDDTGLGTASLQDTDQDDKQHIGKVDIYQEESSEGNASF